MIHIGFTGTQRGCNDYQLRTVRDLLKLHGQLRPEKFFHHGDCIGADAQAHEIAKELGYEIVLHPPVNRTKRAMCQADQVMEPYPYLKRNKHIVDACLIIIATPGEAEEILRSGTWSTVRYAKKQNKFLYLVLPDKLEGYQPDARRVI